MLSIIFYSLLIIIITLPFSQFIKISNQFTFYQYSKDVIYGFIIISFLALLINFFLPLDIYINSLIPLISIVLLIKLKRNFINPIFLKYIIIQSILISILIIKSNVYRPDAGLYHLPYIGILNSEKIIIGLSNLHFRYGHTSIIQYFSAVSNNIIFRENGIVFAQAIIASAVIVNFSTQLFFYNKKKIYNLHFFFLLFVFIYIGYKMNRYSEYGNDAPAHFLLFFLFSEILKFRDSVSYKEYGNQLILSLFIIFNKITLIFVVLLNLIYLNKIKLYSLIKDKRTFVLILFTTLWIIKNILISGCAVYPLKFTCFQNLSWTDTEKINTVQIESEAWTKGFSNQALNEKLSHKKFIEKFNWFDAWVNTHLKLIIKILSPYLIFILLIILLISYKNKKNTLKFDNKNYIYLFLILICCLVWFLKSPLYRYGYSFIISFIALYFGIYCSKLNSYNKFHSALFNYIVILSLVVICSKNLIRIYKVDSNYFNSPWPKYYAMDDKNIITNFEKKKINGLNILTPKSGYCMYKLGVCSHYKINSKIKVVYKKSFKIIKNN